MSNKDLLIYGLELILGAGAFARDTASLPYADKLIGRLERVLDL